MILIQNFEQSMSEISQITGYGRQTLGMALNLVIECN
jgi:hypothetical protein